MTLRRELVTSLLCAAVSAGLVLLLSTGIAAKVGASGLAAKDPGVRAAAAGAGTPLATLSADQLAFFQDGLTRFNAVDSVAGTVTGEPDAGLGPTFNSNSCGNCHAQPAIGGTSPSTNPQIAENILEATLYANQAANAALKQSLGISGHPNISGNDGTITRFGWKAQNKSVEIFAGEAYNVEMGATSELFPEERSLPPSSCLFNPTPEDTTNFPASGAEVLSDVVAFSNFMRFLAPPTPSTQGIPGNPSAQSIADGRSLLTQVHCSLCHTPSLQTGTSSFAAGLNNQSAALLLRSVGAPYGVWTRGQRLAGHSRPG